MLTRRGRRIGRWIRESRWRRVQQRQDAQRGDQNRGESHSTQSPRPGDRHAAPFSPAIIFPPQRKSSFVARVRRRARGSDRPRTVFYLAKPLCERRSPITRSSRECISDVDARWQVNAAPFTRFSRVRFFCHAHAAFSQPTHRFAVTLSLLLPPAALRRIGLFAFVHSRGDPRGDSARAR